MHLQHEQHRAVIEVFAESLKLGMTAFGGPIAHLGYFERAYVRRKGWLRAEQYAGLVALCQVLPGPASSQVGFLIGLHRAGWAGAVAAWLGFTLPSALLMYAFAVLAPKADGPVMEVALHGLKLVAVAVVGQAVWSMGKRLCPDQPRIALALMAMVLLLVAGGAPMQIATLLLGVLGGTLWCRAVRLPAEALNPVRRRSTERVAVGMFLLLLFGLPLVATLVPHRVVALMEVFYRAGALVFGGGHVVLPLLRDTLVPAGWLSDEVFLAGYGIAQAMPGPLFTLAAYLGAAAAPPGAAGLWAVTASVFMFLPGLLVATAGGPVWARISTRSAARGALAGINASVVGILGAALYDPVWITAIHSNTDAATAITGIILLERWRVPPLVVVLLCLVVAAVSSGLH